LRVHVKGTEARRELSTLGDIDYIAGTGTRPRSLRATGRRAAIS
jgi:hypothetical protein